MRRRERWLNISWLQWMAGDEGPHVCLHGMGPIPSVNESMTTLLRDYARIVDMELKDSAVLVRVLPANPHIESGGLAVAACYWGPDLALILATAVAELDLLAGHLVAYKVGRNERERWVAA